MEKFGPFSLSRQDKFNDRKFDRSYCSPRDFNALTLASVSLLPFTLIAQDERRSNLGTASEMEKISKKTTWLNNFWPFLRNFRPFYRLHSNFIRRRKRRLATRGQKDEKKESRTRFFSQIQVLEWTRQWKILVNLATPSKSPWVYVLE